MKSLFFLFLALYSFMLSSCKKNSGSEKNVISSTIHHSIIYKITATIPSPADSARARFSDSIILDRTSSKADDPNYLSNFPYINASISEYFPGFSILYQDPKNPFPYFSFTNNAFPPISKRFEINKTYETFTTPNTPVPFQKPFFLGSHTGLEGWNYFVDNIYPTDAGEVSSKTYTKVVFTKREELTYYPHDTLVVADGIISGYSIDYYGPPNSTSYVHRLDFSIRFTGLSITN